MKSSTARIIFIFQLATCATAIAAAGGARPAAAETESTATASLPYETLVAQLSIFENIPLQQRDHVLGGIVIKHRNTADRTAIHIWVLDGAQRIFIPLSADGALFGPVRRDWVARHVIVHTDQPKGSLTIEAGLWIAVPPQRPISLAYLHEGMRQTNAVIVTVARAIGGYLAQLAAPRVHHLTLTLDGCCGGSAVLDIAGSKTVLQQDRNGSIALPDAALEDAAEGWLQPSGAVAKLDPE
jgi:hypothetical protein